MKKEKIYEIFMGLIPFLLVITNHLFFYFYNKSTVNIEGFYPFQSIIIIYIIFLFLVYLTKSYKKSNLILIITSFIITTISQIKMFYMQEPVYLSDVKLIGGLGEVFNITSGTFGSLSKYLSLFLIELALFIITIIIIKQGEDKEIKRNHFYTIPFIILLIVSLPFKSLNNFAKSIFRADRDYSSVTQNSELYYLYGFTGGMYYKLLDSRIYKPDNYNINEVNNALNYTSTTDTKDMDYNIIFILSESFYDITKIDEIKYNEEFLSGYHELKKEGKTIQMISPTFGGRTSNIEYELLAGSNLSFYDNSYIPYLYIGKDYFKNNDSILNIVNKNGLNTISYKTASESLYNVKNVYNYLGFKNKVVESENIDTVGTYTSDKHVTNKIIEYLEKEKDPFFLFATTMENHMPYLKDKYNSFDIKIESSSLSEKDNETLLTYSQGLNDASNELKRLYDYIKTIDKKTIIIFIGDHLPYLSNEEGENLIDKFDYFNTDNEKLNIFRRYNVESLILSNFDTKYDDTNYLSFDMLIPYVLNSNKVKMNNYYSYLIEKSKNILPAFNHQIAVDNNGNIYYLDELNDEMKKEYNLRESMQYKLYYE